MILYQVFPTERSITGCTFTPTLREARSIARDCASEGETCTVSRLTIGPISREIVARCLNNEGFAENQTELETYQPLYTGKEDEEKPYRVRITRHETTA